MRRGSLNFYVNKTQAQIKRVDIRVNEGLFGTVLDVTVERPPISENEPKLLMIPFNERITSEVIGKIKIGDFVIIHSVFPLSSPTKTPNGTPTKEYICISLDPVVFKVEPYEPKRPKRKKRDKRKKVAKKRLVLPDAVKERIRKKKQERSD